MEQAGVEVADFGWWLSQVRLRYQIACDELRLSSARILQSFRAGCDDEMGIVNL